MILEIIKCAFNIIHPSKSMSALGLDVSLLTVGLQTKRHGKDFHFIILVDLREVRKSLLLEKRRK